MLSYQTPISWTPDATYINSTSGIHYLAWQIGRDEIRELALWLIAPVIPTPEDLETLLPVGYLEIEFIDDVERYGFRRSALPKLSISDLQDEFLAEVALVEQSVIDGYR